MIAANDSSNVSQELEQLPEINLLVVPHAVVGAGGDSWVYSSSARD
jgi:hypothetical protein